MRLFLICFIANLSLVGCAAGRVNEGFLPAEELNITREPSSESQKKLKKVVDLPIINGADIKIDPTFIQLEFFNQKPANEKTEIEIFVQAYYGDNSASNIASLNPQIAQAVQIPKVVGKRRLQELKFGLRFKNIPNRVVLAPSLEIQVVSDDVLSQKIVYGFGQMGWHSPFIFFRCSDSDPQPLVRIGPSGITKVELQKMTANCP